MFRDFRDEEALAPFQPVPVLNPAAPTPATVAVDERAARDAAVEWLRSNTQAADGVAKPSFVRRALRAHGDALAAGLAGFAVGAAMILPGILFGAEYAIVAL